MDNARFAQPGHVVAEARLGCDVGELAAGQAGFAASGKLADDGKPRIVAKRGQHRGERDLIRVGMRQRHGRRIGIAGRQFNASRGIPVPDGGFGSAIPAEPRCRRELSAAMIARGRAVEERIMRWRGERQSDNIEDRRGEGDYAGSPGRGGFRIPIGLPVGGRGGGISGIVILVVIFFVLKFLGIDPIQLLNEAGTGQVATQTGQTREVSTQRNDQMKQFVATVLGSTEDVWGGLFQAGGKVYERPRLVLFTGHTRSACGLASEAAGPFYCPADHKVYIDLSFYNDLANRFHAAGDFAQAYVIAHEVGHHVQNLLGILPKVDQMRQSMGKADSNRLSVRIELQADCFAGVWGHYVQQKGLIEAGDIEEALNAANQIGDDTLEKETQGYVVPDSFTHGTSKQRQTWFSRGYQSGKVADCDTFSGPI